MSDAILERWPVAPSQEPGVPKLLSTPAVEDLARYYQQLLNRASDESATVVFMARRAYCTFRVLDHFGAIDIPPDVADRVRSQRILEYNKMPGAREWLKPVVYLIDDTVKSGFTMTLASDTLEDVDWIERVERVAFASSNGDVAKALSIDVEHRVNDSVLDALARDLYRLLGASGFPYFVDFPQFDPFGMTTRQLDTALGSPYWEGVDISSDAHRAGNITALSIAPRLPLHELMTDVFGDYLKITQLLKARVYLHQVGEHHAETRVMPKWALRMLTETDVSELLEALQINPTFYASSLKGRFRQVQYCLSFLAGEFFFETLPQDIYVDSRPDLDVDEVVRHTPFTESALITELSRAAREHRDVLVSRVREWISSRTRLPGKLLPDSEQAKILQGLPRPRGDASQEEMVRQADLVFLQLSSTAADHVARAARGLAESPGDVDVAELRKSGQPTYATLRTLKRAANGDHEVNDLQTGARLAAMIGILNDAGIGVPTVRDDLIDGVAVRVFRAGENTPMAADAHAILRAIEQRSKSPAKRKAIYELCVAVGRARQDVRRMPTSREQALVEKLPTFARLAGPPDMVSLAAEVANALEHRPVSALRGINLTTLAQATRGIEKLRKPTADVGSRLALSADEFHNLASHMGPHVTDELRDILFDISTYASVLRDYYLLDDDGKSERAAWIIEASSGSTSPLGAVLQSEMPSRGRPRPSGLEEPILGPMRRPPWSVIVEMKRHWTNLVLYDSEGHFAVPSVLLDLPPSAASQLRTILDLFRRYRVSLSQIQRWLASPLASIGNISPIQALKTETVGARGSGGAALIESALKAAVAFRA